MRAESAIVGQLSLTTAGGASLVRGLLPPLMLHLSLLLAYIDPGSGALLVQMLIAGALGAMAFFRRAIFGVFGIFRRKPKDEEEPPKDR